MDEALLASSPVDIQFSFGTFSPPIFREIATHLAAVRGVVAVGSDSIRVADASRLKPAW